MIIWIALRVEGRAVIPCYLEKGVRDEGLKSEISEALVSEFSDKNAPTRQKSLRKPLQTRRKREPGRQSRWNSASRVRFRH